MNRIPFRQQGQSILEFTAGMVVLCLIIYGMVELFRWGMMDLAERRYDHDATLLNNTISTAQQLNPGFHQTRPLDATLFKR